MTHSTLPVRPWLALYTGEALPQDHRPGTLLELFDAAARRDSAAPAMLYLGAAISYAELDALSDSFAAILLADGFDPGSRLAIYMQNMPQFVIAALAAWKAGGIAVPINPMNRAVELAKLLPDCRPTVIVVLDELMPHMREAIVAIPDYAPRLIATSAHWFGPGDDRVLPPLAEPDGTAELMNLIADAADHEALPEPVVHPDDTAMLVYTSGTTGQPKGAMLSHANMTFNAEAVLRWYNLDAHAAPIMALAPLFHVAGAMSLPISWVIAQPMVLIFRFQPEVALEAIAATRPCFMVTAITAYIALLNAPDATAAHFASFRVLLSGGAPIPPAVIDAFEARTGRYIHNGYGLTETSGGVVAVPLGVRAPVDQETGTLSIGVPKYGVDLWIAGEDGTRLPAGEIGEIVVSGTAVSQGYWNKPAETTEAMRSDGFRTGDVGFLDGEGWVYLVDRKKDMINASGYKVWPREVEDVLYTHPAIREAGVTGRPDAYRGETICAIVSLKQGATLDREELMQWCRDRMAAYKVPRDIHILPELPKTPTGKILRRTLRDLEF